MGRNHSPGEKLQTFGLEREVVARIDAVRAPLYKTRSGFYRAAVLEKLSRIEEGSRPRDYGPHRAASQELNEPVSSAQRIADSARSIEHHTRHEVFAAGSTSGKARPKGAIPARALQALSPAQSAPPGSESEV